MDALSEKTRRNAQRSAQKRLTADAGAEQFWVGRKAAPRAPSVRDSVRLPAEPARPLPGRARPPSLTKELLDPAKQKARELRRTRKRAYRARKSKRDHAQLAQRLAETSPLSRELLDYADLRALGIGYSMASLYRLMTEGKFPQRVGGRRPYATVRQEALAPPRR